MVNALEHAIEMRPVETRRVDIELSSPLIIVEHVDGLHAHSALDEGRPHFGIGTLEHRHQPLVAAEEPIRIEGTSLSDKTSKFRKCPKVFF